jgi:hypothetical protein
MSKSVHVLIHMIYVFFRRIFYFMYGLYACTHTCSHALRNADGEICLFVIYLMTLPVNEATSRRITEW